VDVLYGLKTADHRRPHRRPPPETNVLPL